MAKGFWVKVKPQADFYGSATWKAVNNVWVKASPTSWQSVADMWVKVKPAGDAYGSATWKLLYSAGTAADTPLEILYDFNSSKKIRLQGKNYHWTPNPSTLQYKFSVVDASTNVTQDITSYTNTTNPSTGSSITLPGTSTYVTVGDEYVMPGVKNVFQFIVRGSTGSGLYFIEKAEYEFITPKAPNVSATFLTSTSVRLTIQPYSTEDYFATNRYIVYTYDSTMGFIYSGGGRGGYAADSSSKQVTITGLTAGREYTFYVLPVTGDSGSNLDNFTGYAGLEGSVTSANQTPEAQGTPTIEGNSYPGGTVYIQNTTWIPTPTSYNYQWERSSDTNTFQDIVGATSDTYSIPSNFLSSGYNWLRCRVTAVRGSNFGVTNSFARQVIAQQLATPSLSIGSSGYTTYPSSYVNVNVNNYYSAYTLTETWSGSVSPSAGITISQNQEFPEEWNISGMSPGVSYTITISVNKTGFIGASNSISFTGLPRIASTPTFSTFFGSTSGNGFIYVQSNDASSIGWSVYRTANGTGTSGYGNLNTYGLFDGGTIGSSSGLYYVPRNGYFYMSAVGYNSDGSSTSIAYSNGNGQSGTQRNWFYTGPADAPTAGFSYGSGSDAILNWTAYFNTSNNNMGASYLNNVTSYEVYWYPNNTAPSSSVSGDFTGITGTSYTTSQGYSTTRYWWVRGVTNSGNIVGYSPWVALGAVSTGPSPGVAPSGLSVSLSPGGTQQARTTITASVSGPTSGTSPITYSVQIFKATGSNPTNASTPLESGTTSASHYITDSEASGTPDRFIAYATATNAFGSTSAYSNVVISTPYVPPVTCGDCYTYETYDARTCDGYTYSGYVYSFQRRNCTDGTTPACPTISSYTYQANSSSCGYSPITYSSCYEYYRDSGSCYCSGNARICSGTVYNRRDQYTNGSFTAYVYDCPTTSWNSYDPYGCYVAPNLTYWKCNAADVANPSNPCVRVGQCLFDGNDYFPDGCVA